MNQPAQQQEVPGSQRAMDPVPDCGESSYAGSEKLSGKVAVITGGDSGIGRAVAIAFPREGADVVISYLSEHEDAQDTAQLVEATGRKALSISGDVSQADHCRDIVERTVREFGHLNVLVSNAAFQMSHSNLEEISDGEWEHTFVTNVSAMFYLVKAALPHIGRGRRRGAPQRTSAGSPHRRTVTEQEIGEGPIGGGRRLVGEAFLDQAVQEGLDRVELRSGRRNHDASVARSHQWEGARVPQGHSAGRSGCATWLPRRACRPGV
jgi:NAD(P)-dependent dehydrogenase (short-subunit alcohol dehydrogenase family)